MVGLGGGGLGGGGDALAEHRGDVLAVDPLHIRYHLRRHKGAHQDVARRRFGFFVLDGLLVEELFKSLLDDGLGWHLAFTFGADILLVVVPHDVVVHVDVAESGYEAVGHASQGAQERLHHVLGNVLGILEGEEHGRQPEGAADHLEPLFLHERTLHLVILPFGGVWEAYGQVLGDSVL